MVTPSSSSLAFTTPSTAIELIEGARPLRLARSSVIASAMLFATEPVVLSPAFSTSIALLMETRVL